MAPKGSSFWVFAFSYLILVAGVITFGFDLQRRAEWSVPTSIGTVVGETALFLTGLIAQVIGQSIRKLEKRLDEIEARRRS